MKNIRHMRKLRNLTQKDLASKCRMSRAKISGFENGKGNPTQETYAKIASALNCKISELID